MGNRKYIDIVKLEKDIVLVTNNEELPTAFVYTKDGHEYKYEKTITSEHYLVTWYYHHYTLLK